MINSLKDAHFSQKQTSHPAKELIIQCSISQALHDLCGAQQGRHRSRGSEEPAHHRGVQGEGRLRLAVGHTENIRLR